MKRKLEERKKVSQRKKNKLANNKRTLFTKKSQAKKIRVKLDSESEEDECFCLVCLEPYSKSRSKEVWIQCQDCKGWVMKPVPRTSWYICVPQL